MFGSRNAGGANASLDIDDGGANGRSPLAGREGLGRHLVDLVWLLFSDLFVGFTAKGDG